MAKKVTVDVNLCVGCGLCEQNCPEIFKIEDGLAKVVVHSCDQHDVKNTAEQCPVAAIKVE